MDSTVQQQKIDAAVDVIYANWEPSMSLKEGLRIAVEAGIRIAGAPNRAGLTKCQHDLLSFIRSYINGHGYPPSFDEMADAVGLRSKSGVHRMITALEDRGAIRRLPNRARAIEVVY